MTQRDENKSKGKCSILKVNKKSLPTQRYNGFENQKIILRDINTYIYIYIPNFQSCLKIDLGRETDGNNEICLGVRFALSIIKALRLACIEHYSGTVITPFLPSINTYKKCQLNSLSKI